MKTIDKRKLTEIIHKRLGGSLSKSSIYDAINVINDSLIEMVVDNKAISVSNFGTIAPYVFHKHKGLNISTGEIQEVEEFKTVKFRVHDTFQTLVAQKKHKFKKASE